MRLDSWSALQSPGVLMRVICPAHTSPVTDIELRTESTPALYAHGVPTCCRATHVLSCHQKPDCDTRMPRSDAPAHPAPHITMALGRGCSLRSRVGESPTLWLARTS